MKSVLILSATARLKMRSRLRNAFSQPTMLRHFGGFRDNGDPSLFSCDGRQGKPCSRLVAKRSTNWDGLVSCSLMRAQKFVRSEEHTSELQSRLHLVCRLLLEKKKKKK